LPRVLGAIGGQVSAIDGPGYLWLGPDGAEARAAYARARAAGMNLLRSMVIGCIASFRDGWAFRHTIARKVGCSVRTVQRAINEGRALGLIQVFRAKKGERPPGCSTPLKCGWSHRITVGFGRAAAAALAAVAAARVKWMLRHPPKMPAPTLAAGCQADKRGTPIVRALTKPPPTPNQRRTWTAEEIDAELERIERAKAALSPPE